VRLPRRLENWFRYTEKREKENNEVGFVVEQKVFLLTFQFTHFTATAEQTKAERVRFDSRTSRDSERKLEWTRQWD
jgi:hypothetical protein